MLVAKISISTVSQIAISLLRVKSQTTIVTRANANSILSHLDESRTPYLSESKKLADYTVFMTIPKLIMFKL